MSIKASLSFTGALQRRQATGLDASRAAPAPFANDPAHAFDEAMRLIEHGRWQPAFTRLAALADAGHPQAARIAMIFVRRGASLFGGRFTATARQREGWQRAGE